jgi:hypothetical protein
MNELNQEILNRLDLLAEKLGVTVEMLWKVCVKQAYIDGYYSIFWIVFGLFIIAITFYTGKKVWEKVDEGDGYWKTDKKVAVVVIFLCMNIFSVVSIVDGINGTKKIINPEYYAFREIKRGI